jgi:hypothetical protein
MIKKNYYADHWSLYSYIELLNLTYKAVENPKLGLG